PVVVRAHRGAPAPCPPAPQPQAAHDQLSQALPLAKELGFKSGIAGGTRAFGILAAREQRHEEAARLFGTADAILESIGGRLPGFQSLGYDAALADTQSALGREAFQRCWDEGRRDCA